MKINAAHMGTHRLSLVHQIPANMKDRAKDCVHETVLRTACYTMSIGLVSNTNKHVNNNIDGCGLLLLKSNKLLLALRFSGHFDLEGLSELDGL